ncbi:TonB-dependent receptor [Acidipila sp. EB88]|uniref:TonB-dependent receptor n=1 Tax=Acidipila sp. EB88 TaxID=2305226 RepID=UPI000F6022F1|nr:TonB-dependent receptor [Acidipila sp. EB88]RRA49557.1 TonB-dependent receptor [Acidipila sp. EB88]
MSRFHLRRIQYFLPLASLSALCLQVPCAHAQAAGSSGSIYGTVTDGTGAIIPNASVTLLNPRSGYSRQATTDSSGNYQFSNLPFNSYHLVVSAGGFGAITEDAAINSSVPVVLKDVLQVGKSAESVTVTGSDLIESDTTFHTDLDRGLFSKLPLESQSSGLSSLVTLASPGVAADSNGLFHGLGDHASNSFYVDGQPITDQQSKVFSNQTPVNAVQSLQVISGAPPAQFGDKTSLDIVVTTRSGQGLPHPTGDLVASYGTFGSANGIFDLGVGGPSGGNFFEIDGLNTGRFLDPPEFVVFHDKGNEQNVFDRIDRQLSEKDALHLNLNYSRSWFQTPNTYDNLNVSDVVSAGTSANPVFGNVGDADQHSKIETFNIAPSYTHVLNNTAVFNIGPYVRKDAYNYYPSGNPLADLGPVNLQRESIAQQRTLLNAGVHTELSFTRGIHTAQAGAVYQQTFLREHDNLGIVDSTLNAPCLDASGNSLPGFSDPSSCALVGQQANTAYNPVLAPYDLTRNGGEFAFFGHTDVKELALYVQDEIHAGNWLLNLGIRGDLYNGLTVARQGEPRLGVSYRVNRSNTLLRVSYARTLESPFNENLVLSSIGCGDAVLNPLLACAPGVTNTVERPGTRNEFHAGFQQAVGRHVVVNGDYIWKYTHNAFDFSVLGNTPITFPIDWHNSKIPGFVLSADLVDLHGFTAFVVMSSVAARFFNPQLAGAGATPGNGNGNLPFRIDHDEKYNQTTHLQYQVPGKYSPWFSFNWRFDSGLVAGSAPCYNDVPGANTGCSSTASTNGQQLIDLSGYTADQESEAGLVCNGIRATPFQALPGNQCLASQLTSKLITIPAPNTENDDKNPQRIAPRSLFDVAVGKDNLFGGEKYRWSARLTGINISDKYALYNFLSTFSGTHYVTPRALNGEVGFHF